MDPSIAMALLPFLSLFVGYVCGHIYIKMGMRRQPSKNYTPLIVFAGVLVAALCAILGLVLFPLIIPTPGAGGPVQFWVGSSAMFMWRLRVQVFGMLISTAPMIAGALVICAIVLSARKQFYIATMMLVPPILYALTMAAIFYLNTNFIPTA